MALTLTSHIVAFIDFLGFSEMVRKDCESHEPPRHLQLLYAAHTRAAAIFAQDLDSGLIQFSDSIVFSKPYSAEALKGFLISIAVWQRSLLRDGLLCRGGITFGKHFVKDKFLFSQAMIDAYELESTTARYPRIVVSQNLLDLVKDTISLADLPLRREDDGIAFVDYLGGLDGDKDEFIQAVVELAEKNKNAKASVQEKMRWLTRYADHVFESSLAAPQFIKEFS